MVELSVVVLALITLAVLVGSITQTTVGLGLGLVSAPVITIVAPELMPGVPIMLAATLPFLTLVRDHHDIDWPGLGWSVPWRILGTGAGVLVVAKFSGPGLELFVGVVVLLAVILTVRTLRIPINRCTLSVAGFIGGVTGTATSIGGPPVALLYQHRPPGQVRTTMAVYFVSGAAFSLLGLGLSGELTGQEAQVALAMIPVLIVGVVLGSVLRPQLPLTFMRPALLVVSGLSAIVLIVRALI